MMWGLGIDSKDFVLMLWTYLDETGIHDRKSGLYTHLAIGGAMARCSEWKLLEPQWKQALKDENLSEFHMSNFESNDYEFNGWPEERHRNFLNRLLNIIHNSNIRAFLGAGKLSTKKQKGSKWFPAEYGACVSGLLPNLLEQANFVDSQDSKIMAVFALHKEFNYHRAAYYFESISRGAPKQIQMSTAFPSSVVQLQVADLVIYEVVRWLYDPNRPIIPQRYPLHSLWSRGASVNFRRLG